MGGNAIKNTVRLGREEVFNEIYPIISDSIKLVEEKLVSQFLHSPLTDYAEKNDYGDLDIIIGVDDYSAFLDKITECLLPVATEFNRNKQILSVGIPVECGNFQVDLVCVPERYFFSSMLYYSFNDLGNLMGRIARALGFKYGHCGLTYVYRDSECDTRLIEEIEVSKDGRKIFEFLGYSWDSFADNPCKSLEDIFRFASSSVFFDKSLFAYENLNNPNRVRNKKRRTYRMFLEWLEENHQLSNFDWQNPEVKEMFRRNGLQRAFNDFPGFRKNYLKAQDKERTIKKYREKFNGDLVKTLTGLEDKELGNRMRAVHQRFRVMKPENLTVEEYVVYHLTPKQIIDIIENA